jgi:hypothetical protein
MKCRYCAKEIQDDAVTCEHCGKAVMNSDYEEDEYGDKHSEMEDVSLEVWDTTTARLFGPTKLELKLTDIYAELNGSPGKRIQVPEDKAHQRIKFLDQPFVGKDKTQHLDGMSQVSFSSWNKTIKLAMEPEAVERLREWMPPLTAKTKLKIASRQRAVMFLILGASQLGLFGFVNLIGGVACLILAALNFLIARRAMYLLNGIVLAAAGVMNILIGGLLPVLLGIASLLWGLGELWTYTRSDKQA